jgi:hypothetical protein
MVDLNTKIDPATGWVVLGASGINDAGQIAAWGTNNLTGARHALRLTPVGSTGDATVPTVRFVNPTDGATVRGRVKVKVEAADNVALARVALRVDGVLVAETTTSDRLAWTWRTSKFAAGAHTLTAVATDTSGNQASRSITVTVRR